MDTLLKCLGIVVLSVAVAGPAFAQEVDDEELEIIDDAQTDEGLEQEQEQISKFDLTPERLFRESSKEVARMRKIFASHKKLLQDAQRTGLVVAVEAIRKDLAASRELYFLAEQMLNELESDLELQSNKAKATQIKISDPLAYPQVKEIQILSDQAEQLYRTGKRFLISMQRPTELKVTREDVDEEDEDE